MIPIFVDRTDRLLLALGVVGIVLFLALMPRYHPDAAATYGIGAAEAEHRAEQFLEQAGYATEGLVVRSRLARSPELLDSLQESLGRRSMIVALKEGGRDRIPAFSWRVEYLRPAEGFDAAQRPLEVQMLPNGRVWGMMAATDHMPVRGIDVPALRRAFGPEVQVRTDQRLAELMTFDIPGPLDADEIFADLPDAERLARAEREEEIMGLTHAAAAALARAHIERTALADLDLIMVRVEPHPARGRTAARVVFESDDGVFGQRVRSEVDVAAAGALLRMRTRFNDVVEARQQVGSLTFSSGGSTYREVLKWGGYVLLVLVLMGVAIRRLSARSVDVQAAFKDAFAVAFFSALSVLLGIPLFLGEFGFQSMMLLLFVGVGVIMNGFLLGALAFVTTAGGDALARRHDASPIRTLALARQGLWINLPVGQALVRGVALGVALVGGTALLMGIFADSVVPVAQQSRYFESQNTYSLLLSSISGWVWYVMLATHAIFVGLGAILARWRPSLAMPGLVLALATLGLAVIRLPVGPEWVTWSAALAVGIGMAFAYLRTDALTILIALLVAGALWGTREGLLVGGSPAVVDLIILFALLAGVMGFGAWAMARGQDGDQLPVYEPEFIVEQRERARLQREFEIAREVQQSFLPRHVPEIKGLDLAARCVPAEEVGGDYYDLIPLGRGRLAVIIGDVSGKGIQAAFFMTLVKGYVQALAHEVDSPAEVLTRLNTLFRDSSRRGTFVSMIYGVMDTHSCTLTFARAGHTPLVIKRAEGAVSASRPAGMAIGMAEEATFRASIAEETIELCPDDLLVLYTDGISEAMNRRRDEFSDERILAVVKTAPNNAVELLDAVVNDVRQHVGRAAQHDDLTMVVVRVASDAVPPGAPLAPSITEIADVPV